MFGHIETYSDISRHNQTYLDIFGNYSGIFWSRYNPGIFQTLVYSESWHIHNQCIYRTLVYLKLWHNQNQRHSESYSVQNAGIFNTGGILRILSNGALWETSNGYFHKLFPQYQLFMSSWNKDEFSLQKSLFYVNKYGGQVEELETVNFDIPPQSFAVI